jgi:hypothetical protein
MSDDDATADVGLGTSGEGLTLSAIVRSARCTGWPDLPWTGDARRTSPDEAAVMRAVCQSCPVVHACAAYADATGVTGGFWAGHFRDASAQPGVGGAA